MEMWDSWFKTYQVRPVELAPSLISVLRCRKNQHEKKPTLRDERMQARKLRKYRANVSYRKAFPRRFFRLWDR